MTPPSRDHHEKNATREDTESYCHRATHWSTPGTGPQPDETNNNPDPRRLVIFLPTHHHHRLPSVAKNTAPEIPKTSAVGIRARRERTGRPRPDASIRLRAQTRRVLRHQGAGAELGGYRGYHQPRGEEVRERGAFFFVFSFWFFSRSFYTNPD